MNKNAILLMVVLAMPIIFILGCVSSRYTTENFKGEFERPGFKEKIVLTDSSFVHLEGPGHSVLYACCDTISFGRWEINQRHKMLVFTSSEGYLNPALEVSVNESTGRNDTVVLMIDSPLEKYINRENRADNRDVDYSGWITTPQGSLTQISSQKGSSVLKFFNPSREPIQSFFITVDYGPGFWGRHRNAEFVRTKVYEVRDSRSNVFTVHIPDLSYSFMAIKRVNRDFVKILSKKELEWDGVVYRKR